jgi:MoaA/NifB/PqqE/SkfB family radical SAM enzyme
MKPIKENVVIHIELTNACHLSCANCSRLVGHHAKPFFITLDEVRLAIDSLEGFEGRIGMMGGGAITTSKNKRNLQDLSGNDS